MYLWHSPANKDGTQSDPSQSKSCQHALLEHINGTVYPWGNQTHTHTPIYKNIISHPLVQTFRQKKRCIRCQFQLQSLLCYYFLYLYHVPSCAKPPKNTSAEADFLIDQNINLYTNKNSENIDHIFYTITRGQSGSYQISLSRSLAYYQTSGIPWKVFEILWKIILDDSFYCQVEKNKWMKLWVVLDQGNSHVLLVLSCVMFNQSIFGRIITVMQWAKNCTL